MVRRWPQIENNPDEKWSELCRTAVKEESQYREAEPQRDGPRGREEESDKGVGFSSLSDGIQKIKENLNK